jgi:hypothetical protein
VNLRASMPMREVEGQQSRRFELEHVDSGQVLLSLDLTDALGLVQWIAGGIAAVEAEGGRP